MPKITHFEINADDPLRAKSFYEKVFDWKIEKWESPIEYWLVMTGEETEEGIDGGLQQIEASEDQIFNYIQVSDVDEYKNRIEKSGGIIESPKITVPKVGYIYMFKDTEGNKLGIMYEDENAK